jgi:hypothetical protein
MGSTNAVQISYTGRDDPAPHSFGDIVAFGGSG